MTLDAMRAVCGLTRALDAPTDRTDRPAGPTLIETLRRLFAAPHPA